MLSSQTDWAQVGGNEPDTLLNDYYSDVSGSSREDAVTQFALFGQFPIEIRYMIWQCALLPTNRLIGIFIEDINSPPRFDQDPAILSASNRRPRNRYPGEKYHIHLTTAHRTPLLMMVNRESRQVALNFYRVHFPCDLYGQGPKQRLYFNPELDYFDVRTQQTQPELFTYFNFDFLSHDPKGLGIQNLIVTNIGCPGFLPLPIDLSSLSSVPVPEASAFKVTITNLRNVFFYTRAQAESRFMCSLLRMTEVRFNRSYPISTRTEPFQILDRDPRPIDADLEKVALLTDPRSIFHSWILMERNLGIDRSDHMPRFQYLLTSAVDGSHVPDATTRSEAVQQYSTEQQHWRSLWDFDNEASAFVRPLPDPDTFKPLKHAPLPAFGFWLLPLTALGEPRDRYGQRPRGNPRGDNDRWSRNMVVNLTEHRPKLAIFELS